MKFFKELSPVENDSQPPVNRPVPMRTKDKALPDDNNQLADLDAVARKLRISKRHVQTLVRRKAIPVIRLGRRCTRFDLDSVMSAVKKFEITEVR